MAAFIKDQSVSVGTNGRNEQWKSDAFINFYMPAKNGARRKIGFIALKKNRAIERQLIEFLSASDENVDTLLSKLEVEFNLAEASEDNLLDL